MQSKERTSLCMSTVVRVKTTIREVKPQLVDVFGQAHLLHSRIFSVLNELNEDEVHTVCGELLGFEHDCCAGPEDVIHCILNYEVAVEFASNVPPKKDGARKTRNSSHGNNDVTLDFFYNTNLHSAVERVWAFVCQSLGIDRSTTICKKSGMLCIIGNGEDVSFRSIMRRPYVFKCQRCVDVVKVLNQLGIYLLERKYGPSILSVISEAVRNGCSRVHTAVGNVRLDRISVNPSIENVEDFLRNLDGGGSNYSGHISGAEVHCRTKKSNASETNTPNCKSHPIKASLKSTRGCKCTDKCTDMSNDESASDGSESVCIDDYDNNCNDNTYGKAYLGFLEWSRSKSDTLSDGSNIKYDIDRAETFKDILEFMPSAKLNRCGDVEANRSDWNVFLNSPLVSSLVIEEIHL